MGYFSLTDEKGVRKSIAATFGRGFLHLDFGIETRERRAASRRAMSGEFVLFAGFVCLLMMK